MFKKYRRWHTIRDCYTRSKKDDVVYSGMEGGTPARKWEPTPFLVFLDDFVTHRPLAATNPKVLKPHQWKKLNLARACKTIDDIICQRFPVNYGREQPKFSLYLSSQLMYGVALILQWKFQALYKYACFEKERFKRIRSILRGLPGDEDVAIPPTAASRVTNADESPSSSETNFGETISPDKHGRAVVIDVAPFWPFLPPDGSVPDTTTVSKKDITMVEIEEPRPIVEQDPDWPDLTEHLVNDIVRLEEKPVAPVPLPTPPPPELEPTVQPVPDIVSPEDGAAPPPESPPSPGEMAALPRRRPHRDMPEPSREASPSLPDIEAPILPPPPQPPRRRRRGPVIDRDIRITEHPGRFPPNFETVERDQLQLPRLIRLTPEELFRMPATRVIRDNPRFRGLWRGRCQTLQMPNDRDHYAIRHYMDPNILTSEEEEEEQDLGAPAEPSMLSPEEPELPPRMQTLDGTSQEASLEVVREAADSVVDRTIDRTVAGVTETVPEPPMEPGLRPSPIIGPLPEETISPVPRPEVTAAELTPIMEVSSEESEVPLPPIPTIFPTEQEVYSLVRETFRESGPLMFHLLVPPDRYNRMQAAKIFSILLEFHRRKVVELRQTTMDGPIVIQLL